MGRMEGKLLQPKSQLSALNWDCDTSPPSIHHPCPYDPLVEVCLQPYLSQPWGPWPGSKGPEEAGLGLHSP